MRVLFAISFFILFAALQIGFEYGVSSLWVRVALAAILGGIIGLATRPRIKK